MIGDFYAYKISLSFTKKLYYPMSVNKQYLLTVLKLPWLNDKNVFIQFLRSSFWPLPGPKPWFCPGSSSPFWGDINSCIFFWVSTRSRIKVTCNSRIPKATWVLWSIIEHNLQFYWILRNNSKRCFKHFNICMVAYPCPLCASCFSIKYVNMKDNYVDVQDRYVNMQQNYVEMQDNCN